jgi:short-subunit dehydrogenase
MNIIVTGASQGIGFEICKIFSGESNNTVIAISRNENKLKKLKSECLATNSGSNLIPVAFDLEQIIDNPESISDIILQHCVHIDILINNAGFLINKPFTDTSYSEALKTFNINLFVPALLIKELSQHMGKKNISHVVNISSMAGFQGSSKFPGLVYYSSSKAALAGLTECLSSEFVNSRIYFNCLAIGSVSTDMFAKAFPGVKARFTPEAMAEYIVNFAKTGYKYLRGKVIPVSISVP